jgi:hypothetical protein
MCRRFLLGTTRELIRRLGKVAVAATVADLKQ